MDQDTGFRPPPVLSVDGGGTYPDRAEWGQRSSAEHAGARRRTKLCGPGLPPLLHSWRRCSTTGRLSCTSESIRRFRHSLPTFPMKLSTCGFSHGLPGGRKIVLHPLCSSHPQTAPAINAGAFSLRMSSGTQHVRKRHSKVSCLLGPVASVYSDRRPRARAFIHLPQHGAQLLDPVRD